jgi:hypothetical protein
VFNLGEVPGSASDAWPAKEVNIDGIDTVFYVPETCGDNINKLHWVILVGMNDYDVMSYTWMSPLHFCLKHPGKPCPGAVAAPTGPPEPIHHVASRCGWWTLSRTMLAKFMSFFGFDHGVEASAFDLAFDLVQKTLGTSDEETLVCLEHRIKAMHEKANVIGTDQLFDFEEVREWVDKEDLKDVKDAQKQRSQCKDAASEFVKAFASKRQSVRYVALGKGGGKGRGKGRGRGRGGGHPWGERVFPELPPDAISQVEARRLLPDKAHIWQAHKHQTWCGHLRPFPRVSMTWSAAGGQRAAAIAVVRKLWEQYLSLEGMTTDSCPVKGLFA